MTCFNFELQTHSRSLLSPPSGVETEAEIYSHEETAVLYRWRRTAAPRLPVRQLELDGSLMVQVRHSLLELPLLLSPWLLYSNFLQNNLSIFFFFFFGLNSAFGCSVIHIKYHCSKPRHPEFDFDFYLFTI